MAKTKKVQVAEIQRRKAQSKKDKRAANMGRQVVPRAPRANATKKGTRTGSDVTSYARLVLDPCHGDYATSNLPGQGGGQQVRMPFRQTVYLPTASTNIANTTYSGTQAYDTLLACLTPHSMVAGSGPAVLTINALPNETWGQVASNVSANTTIRLDPPALSQVNAIAGEMRPVSACVRITCLAQDTANSGFFLGYEGPARQFVNHVGDDTTDFFPNCSPQNIIFNGQTSQDTYKTYEVRINYPNADQTWQEWRQITGTTSGATGVYRAGDGSDPDWSDMPVALVGVSSGTPGAKYLIDGAVVYEWMPRIANGITPPAKRPADAGALEKTAKAVQKVANGWGGMLISSAVNYATGGNAGAILGVLRQGYAAYTAAQAGKSPW